MGPSGPLRPRPGGTIRAAAILVGVFLGCMAWDAPVAAQMTPTCTTCLGLFNCDEKAASCSAECTARLFAIDPRRAECLRTCNAEATSCSQTAARDCRSILACR
ncbi:MAG: hypothetical protein AB7F35_18340 [Acetobacteraceae bacterium]